MTAPRPSPRLLKESLSSRRLAEYPLERVNSLNSSLTEPEKSAEERKRVNRNSLLLLLLLTMPVVGAVALLFLLPDIIWVSEITYTATEVFGSFAVIFLSVFIIARYQSRRSEVLYVAAGLLAMGIIGGFHAVSPAGSVEFIWLHSLASIFGGSFFIFYVLAETVHLPAPLTRVTEKYGRWLIGLVAALALLGGLLTIAFSDMLPAMVQEGSITLFAWVMNAVPIALFLFAGANLFRQYRRIGAHELFLFTAILIFLFQASEVFYFATLWGIVWWLWQALQLGVYLAVLGYVLKEYIQTNDSLAVEIGERKKVEEALRKAEEDWRNSFNSLEDAMLIIDRDYRIENINNSGLALIGKSREKVTGRKCYRVIHGENKPTEYCPFRRVLETKKVESVERYNESFGKYFSLKSAPIFGENREITKFVYLMTDITERVRAEEKERQMQQELSLTSRLASIGEMAAGTAHEINNPLTGIIGFAQMLAQMDVPKDIKEAVEVINDGAQRVAGIVDKLLTFARRNRPNKEYVDINSIVRGVVGMRSYEMRTNNIEVTTNFASDLPWTVANVGQLQQVFLNIIINAEQAMSEVGEMGKISIRTERADGNIKVSVADNGPGITADNLDRIFDPFFTTKYAEGGTGLGLSVSYGIINEHGGRIYAKSELGEGATFVVELPVVAQPKQPKKDEPPRPELGKLSGAKIMVVDDEPHICRVLDRLLTREGYKVETKSSAQDALQMLNTAKYDLILLDIKMPDMNGIEFYERMKEIDPSLQQKVVCITGDVVSSRNKAFLDETRIPCITKPFGIEELMHEVESVLGGQGKDAQATYSYC
jgi:PAS domain S-box-containing protein